MTPLIQLLRLASPALPVGAYSYSQGLEWAIESGRVVDPASAESWIGEVLSLQLAHFEAPLLCSLMRAWQATDQARAQALSDRFLASRESAELRAETLQMGYSLSTLLRALPDLPAHTRDAATALTRPTFPALFALAATTWAIPERDTLTAYLWSWLENQIMVLMKALPLGQVAGQQLLSRLAPRLDDAIGQALQLDEALFSNFAPGLAIASCRHETQYSRLFRS